MSTVLTIRNLDGPVKQKLRMLAASHGRSMEAEAREILARAVSELPKEGSPQERMRHRIESVKGIWRGLGTTDQLMNELRGDD